MTIAAAAFASTSMGMQEHHSGALLRAAVIGLTAFLTLGGKPAADDHHPKQDGSHRGREQQLSRLLLRRRDGWHGNAWANFRPLGMAGLRNRHCTWACHRRTPYRMA